MTRDDGSKGKFDTADYLFTKQGFWRKIAPFVGGICLVAAAGILRYSNDRLNWKVAFLILGMCATLLLFVLIRYWSAAARHRELKLRFGDRYRELVETGKIDLSLIKILYSGQPKGVRWKYFNEGNPWD